MLDVFRVGMHCVNGMCTLQLQCVITRALGVFTVL